MVFFLATGEPDSCGPGCNVWIAAEGMFDPGATARFKTFLRSVKNTTPPIFFDSTGGALSEALSIGRILRERNMTAGIGRTFPTACIGWDNPSCLKLKSLPGEVPAALSTVWANCHSACVYALIGAKTRRISPDSQLGIHAPVHVAIHRDGRVLVGPELLTAKAARRSYESVENQLSRYVADMGVPAALVGAASHVPHEKLRILTPQEIISFGIGTVDFSESRWSYINAPRLPPQAIKITPNIAGGKRTRLRLLCENEISMRFNLERMYTGLVSNLRVVTAQRVFPLWRKQSFGGRDGSVDTFSGSIPVDVLEAQAQLGLLALIESIGRPGTEIVRTYRLPTAGLESAITALRASCRRAL